MKERGSEIFSGTTAECLARISQEAEEIKNLVGAVCMVSSTVEPRTVNRWLARKFFPKGENLVHLRFAIDSLIGYQVNELTDLSDPVYQLGKKMMKEKKTIFDLEKDLEIPRESLIDYLLGRSRPISRRASIIDKAVKNGFESQKPNSSLADRKSKTESTDLLSEGMDKEDVKESFNHLIMALRPLAEALLSDAFSPQERRQMREEIGRKNLFRVSLLLDGLSSEDSRKQVKNDIEKRRRKC